MVVRRICRDVTGVSLPEFDCTEGNKKASVREAYYRAEVWNRNLVDGNSFANHTV